MPKGFAIQINDPFDQGDVFDLKIDVIRDTEGEIVSGLSVGSTSEQNQALILLASPGQIKQHPTLGVGIESMLLDSDYLSIRHSIRRSFSMDGLKISELELYDPENIKIKSSY